MGGGLHYVLDCIQPEFEDFFEINFVTTQYLQLSDLFYICFSEDINIQLVNFAQI